MKNLCTLLAVSTALFAQSDKVALGKYLVEEVARCQECHTPKSPEGQFDKEKWLKGAGLNIQPMEPVKGWARASPTPTTRSRLWNGGGGNGLLRCVKSRNV